MYSDLAAKSSPWRILWMTPSGSDHDLEEAHITKATRVGGHVIAEPAAIVNPSLRIKPLWPGKGHRVLRYNHR